MSDVPGEGGTAGVAVSNSGEQVILLWMYLGLLTVATLRG